MFSECISWWSQIPYNPNTTWVAENNVKPTKTKARSYKSLYYPCCFNCHLATSNGAIWIPWWAGPCATCSCPRVRWKALTMLWRCSCTMRRTPIFCRQSRLVIGKTPEGNEGVGISHQTAGFLMAMFDCQRVGDFSRYTHNISQYNLCMMSGWWWFCSMGTFITLGIRTRPTDCFYQNGTFNGEHGWTWWLPINFGGVLFSDKLFSGDHVGQCFLETMGISGS